MMSDITIRRAQLADREQVLALLRSAHPGDPRQGDPAFWNWHFLQHPAASEEQIPVWIALDGPKVVGQLATIPVELDLAGERHPAIWIVDLLLDREYRRRGIMKKLVLAANVVYPYMLGSATRRQHSAALLEGLGWTVFSPMPRYHKLLYPGNALAASPYGRAVRPVLNALYAPFRPRAAGGADSRATVRRLASTDDEFVEFLERSRGHWGCSIGRSPEYLRWQFELQPNKEYELLGAFDGGKMCGYAVLYFRRPTAAGVVDKASISDIGYGKDNARGVTDALISAALAHAVERRAGGLVTDALDPLLEERLRHFGFSRVTSGLEIMATGPRHTDVLFDPKAWHLTRGDSDISIFEAPNR